MKLNIDLTKVCDIEFSGIDHRDAPDYCDAYISEAWIEIDSVLFTILPRESSCEYQGRYFRRATEQELDFLNDSCPEWKYEKLVEWMH